MEELVIRILSENPGISDIKGPFHNAFHLKNQYLLKVEFVYSIKGVPIPFVLGIPHDWERQLVDFYLLEYKDFKYIPHIGENGKLCLFDLEGILIDRNIEALIFQSLQRVYETIECGLMESNRMDFIDEFDSYWRLLEDTKKAKSLVNITGETRLISYTDDKKTVKKEDKDTYLKHKKRMDVYSFYAADDAMFFSLYNDTRHVRKGVYLFLEPDHFIYPPDWRHPISIEYVNSLIAEANVQSKILAQFFSKVSSELYLQVTIKQPSGVINSLAVLVTNFSFSNENDEIKIIRFHSITPCLVVRCDKPYLTGRIGANTLDEPRLLVIGAGSIGGYLISELVKVGLKNIDIVDSDIMKEENIYRHFLGMSSVGKYKAKAMVDWANMNYPFVNPNDFDEPIERLIQDGSVDISEYNLIISAVGNHNLNRWLNDFIYVNAISTPVIYLWNEALGIGSHIAVFRLGEHACYECLFDRDENGEIYERPSYYERGQSFSKKMMGCNTSFIPYSSNASLTTVSYGIRTILDCLKGKIKENQLISIKGCDDYADAGMVTSERYKQQSQPIAVFSGDKFERENCLCNGGQIHGHSI